MCFSDVRIGQGLVFALVGAVISALIIAGFIYPIWVGYTARPGARALKIGRWMGGLPWAISFYASLAARDFRRVDFDILLPWAVILTLAALILAPLVSAGIRGPGLKPPRIGDGGGRCPNTGCLHINRFGARFCARCGTPLRS